MDLDKLEQIKKLAIISVFADDTLMKTLVLKGGNALDIVYKISPRASIDLDFSIESEFDSLNEFLDRLSKSLEKIFSENDYIIFDIAIKEKPEQNKPNTPKFWGGYQLEFKIISKNDYVKHQENIDALRKNATVVGPLQKRKFSIDVSKWEYCEHKQAFELENYTIYAYSPEMIVFEKIRAICQQMPEYVELIGQSYRTARARDFFDIYTVLNHFTINLTTPNNIELLKRIFKQKGVGLGLIKNIRNYKEYHREDFSTIQNTVKPNIELKAFDFYFDYVVMKCDDLCKALGEV
ncbi:MAG: nucleotidyl transferase AbiEii/AbiGii toxin family protein [Phycisphaerae bacterium]|jgi:predicted nucleotidyltransferase component of viral defense system